MHLKEVMKTNWDQHGPAHEFNALNCDKFNALNSLIHIALKAAVYVLSIIKTVLLEFLKLIRC